MMFGYLLARAGVEVSVLEKHADFFRDFRGDTVHPSTLELFFELGLLRDFLKIPHQRITSAGGVLGNFSFTAASFERLPTHCRFIALMPQWDLLDFLAGQARRFPHFRLSMQHEATGLLYEGQRVTGVEVKTPDGRKAIGADLVVACDGRHSTLRKSAGLDVVDAGVPIDVLWFRLSRKSNDSEQVLGRLNFGKAMILINRGDYFQAGLIIRKGGLGQVQRDGLEKLRKDLVQIAPFLEGRVDELKDWSQIKLLTVQINHLRQWYAPGLLCIGDAAHAMSPAGGVGINLAIQDAVAAARILGPALRDGLPTDELLPLVQVRREFPARLTQILQTRAHRAMVRLFDNPGPMVAPWQFQLTMQIPGIQRVFGRLIGMGVRPEHIKERVVNKRLLRVACGIGVGFAALRLLRRPAATV
jgi:2-polyprenyl-6-methoxyphenol hydroxylase-like FAD-dependent oxidoreductase